MNIKNTFTNVGIPVLVFVLICLFGVVTGNIANNKTAGDKYSNTISDEEQYQKGIELIKQDKWFDASIALVSLQEKGYKDSKLLYDYASARDIYKDASIDVAMIMLISDMKKIPAEYNGELKEEIMSFRNASLEKESLEPQEKKDILKPYFISKGLIDLEILSHNWQRTTDAYVTVLGQVKNVTNEPIESVMVVASFYDKDKNFITYDDALIDYNPIMPGQVSPFKIIVRYNPLMNGYRIEFRTFAGEKIESL